MNQKECGDYVIDNIEMRVYESNTDSDFAIGFFFTVNDFPMKMEISYLGRIRRLMEHQPVHQGTNSECPFGCNDLFCDRIIMNHRMVLEHLLLSQRMKLLLHHSMVLEVLKEHKYL